MNAISKGLKLYYKSLEYEKAKTQKTNSRLEIIKSLLSSEAQSTLSLTKKYNEKTGKDITLRRMTQILYGSLPTKLISTKIVNTEGKKGRYRVWTLRQKDSSSTE